MVATVLRLRYRILGNVLASSVWQLIGFVIGAIVALWALIAVVPGSILLGSAGLEVTNAVIVFGGALLTVGWVLGPILVGGIDTSVDPGRLAPFPLTTTQIMLATTAVGLFGIAGITTLLAGLATLGAWVRWPVAAVAAVICVPVGVLTCVIASRLVAAFAARSTGRRLGEVLGMLFFGVLVLAGPIMIGVMNLIGGVDDLGERIGGLVEGLSWTPVAAAWAVPGELAAGRVLAAVAKFAIAVATPVVLWLVWARLLSAASVDAVRSTSRPARGAGGLGWFGRVPTGAFGATFARSLTYWLRDPRYLRNLAIVPLLPVLLGFTAVGDSRSGLLLASGVLVAFIAGLVPYSDVSYDGTAFTSVLAAGVRGRADRAGRMLAAAAVTLPLLVVVVMVTVAISGRWELLPALLGATIGTLLVCLGLSAVSSASLIMPVPESGDNMFKRVPGSQTMGMLVFALLSMVALALSAPAIALTIVAAVTGAAVWGWLALAVGFVIGAGVLVAGIVIGGRTFDRSAPTLLARIKAVRGV